MLRRLVLCVTAGVLLSLAACGNSRLPIPTVNLTNGGTSTVSPQFGNAGAVPQGLEVVFIGDVIVLRGSFFTPDTKVFFGQNSDLARRPGSLLTTPRHLFTDRPFVYTDPVTGENTIMEVEAPVEFTRKEELRVTIPAPAACSPQFTNPIVRIFAELSSEPMTDLFWIVGPRAIAISPKQGLDVGGESITIHGDFFSPYTQVGIRFRDPVTNEMRVIGDTLETDITEVFVDRHTLVVPRWPGIVPSPTVGLASELKVDLLLFESIDEIAGSIAAEPGLDGDPPCNALRPESSEVPLFPNGVRNSEVTGKYTYLPTGVTDDPSLVGLLPESGTEFGGNTVVIHGDQFDAFSVDLGDPANPGIGIECPPGSGQYVAPEEAVLVDRQTIVIRMPVCPVDVPEKVNFSIRNKFSIDHPGGAAAAGPDGSGVVFPDVYTYVPVPPIVPPVVTSILPATGSGEGSAHDFGLQRLMIVGDWFDADTTLNGGVEFILPEVAGLPDPTAGGGNPRIVQAQRVILHNRNLIEVFTRRLPAPYYPLTADLLATVRVRNSAGVADFEDALLFQATPDGEGAPVLTERSGDRGPPSGGTPVLLFGENFDTSTQVRFGDQAVVPQFIHGGLLIAKSPPGTGTVAVRVDDDGDLSAASFDFTYDEEAPDACPVVAFLDPAAGSATGGYSILAYGAALGPTTEVEFGTGSGNAVRGLFFVSDMLARIEVPEALPEQIGATVDVGATDPSRGCDTVVRTVEFTFTAAQQARPRILFLDTTVEAPATSTAFPALQAGGGDRLLVVGSGFDQTTTFDFEKPQASGSGSEALLVTVLTPNLAVMTAPASPDGLPGLADLQAHNAFGDSDEFTVEYVRPDPPTILDVRNLDDGTQAAPIDGADRILIFGDNFFAPLTIRLTGCDLNDPAATITLEFTLASPDVTLLGDHLLGVDIPADTFCEGALGIEVRTDFGTTEFTDGGGAPIFQLIGPQPPVVEGVFPTAFHSAGGEEAVFFGRYFTPTTMFEVKTSGGFTGVLEALMVSDTVAVVLMPELPGGVPPGGLAGSVRAEETDAFLRSKISGDKFTETDGLFTVVNDSSPVLRGVVPDRGSIDGGDRVLLFGQEFLTVIGASNVSGVRFLDTGSGLDLGTYTQATAGELPLGDGDVGKFAVLNNNTILVITNPHAAVTPEEGGATATVVVESDNGNTMLAGAYAYVNTPGVRTPFLLGFTPNQTYVNGGTSHLLSGGFLTGVDRIVLARTSDATTVAIPVDLGAPPTTPGSFAEINDNFLVFVMPDLSGAFDPGDIVTVHAEKDTGGGTLVSNALTASLLVSAVGPPDVEPEITPDLGGAFGGDTVTVTGLNLTPNSQVLFGTLPAVHVVYVDGETLLAIPPRLPVDLPDPGLDLSNIHLKSEADRTVDVAVFTPGGTAVLEGAFTFELEEPVVDSRAPDEVAEGDTVRITVHGDNFVPGLTTATPGAGTVTGLVVETFQTLSFDFTAPTFPPGTDGPELVTITIATNQGTAVETVDLSILLAPFVADCTTDYDPNEEAAPSTGIFDGSFVVATVTGGNFTAGGTLAIRTRVATQLTPLAEIDAAAAFTAQGQFRVVDAATIEFTVPNVFSTQTPTILQGNPNVGAVAVTYGSPAGAEVTEEDCFRYVPFFIDFLDSRFTIPAAYPGLSAPGKVTIGDINADGVPDVVVLAQQTIKGSPSVGPEVPEAYIFYADTFGDGIDFDGDGKSPDFAGTFTVVEVNDDDARTWVPQRARGQAIRLANLDDDDELELIIPVIVDGGGGGGDPVLLVDIEPGGAVGTFTTLTPTDAGDYTAGIAVGNFDETTAHPDIAVLMGDDDPTMRKLVIFKSTGAFAYDEVVIDIPAEFEKFTPGALAAGDFDGDGDDDLIWGQHQGGPSGTKFADRPILVMEVDAAAGSVGPIKALTNLTGSIVPDIDIADVDGDGKEDALVLVRNHVRGALVGTGRLGGGVATVLSPLGLEADFYAEVPFRVGFNDRGGDGIALGHGHLNADGILDLAVVNDDGEVLVYFGKDDGSYESSGRSWQTLTTETEFYQAVQGLDVGDFNGDGLAEILLGDMSGAPFNLVFWINVSR